MQAGQPQVAVDRHQHRRARAAERLGRRLGEGVERLLERDRLAERRGDPVEAPLDAGLAAPLLEALRVAQCERGQVGEGVEQTRLAAREPPLRVARADAEHALDLAGPAHRGDHRRVESRVRLVGDGFEDLRVVLDQRRTAACDRPSGQALVDRELVADQARREAVDGCAAEHAPPGIQQVAVDRLGAKQCRDLVDEALEDRVQLELARDDLCGLQQRALLAEPALVLLEQPGDVNRKGDLIGDGLGERDVRGRPQPGLGTVQAEDAQHPLERDHRRCQRGPRAELL